MRIILVNLCLGLCGFCLAVPESKISVEVVDAAGARLEGCDVAVVFEESGEEVKKSGTSSTNAPFSASFRTREPYVMALAQKSGCYDSVLTYMFTGRSSDGDRMKPWNPTITLELREKRNVTEMLHRIARNRVPVSEDGAVGFDLEKCDWVKPYGNGDLEDLVFSFKWSVDRIVEYTVSFSNPMDGIQRYEIPVDLASRYKWPYEAPESSYQPVLRKIIRGSVTAAKDEKYLVQRSTDVNYIYRIRTEVDEGGNIVSALYGKVRGELKVNAKGTIHFQYWLNTDPHSRSLESTHLTSP